MKVVTIVGARPQFIKAAVVSRAIRQHNKQRVSEYINEVIIHTGQHYDSNMSDVFLKDLQLPSVSYNLGIKAFSHGAMTGNMLEKIENVLLNEKPDIVVVCGDTNSTLAGALAAVKLCIPVAHVEAGLRSFNMKMPEENNRILTDRVSHWLFCPTERAIKCLRSEGMFSKSVSSNNPVILNVGDVMYDAALFYSKVSRPTDKVKQLLKEVGKGFYLSTIHRAENTDNLEHLTDIMEALNEISESVPVVLPLHPRTKKFIKQNNIEADNILFVDPVSYFDMLSMLRECKAVFTDSGGLQKEAYFFKKFCVTLRKETEWVELVEHGYSFLAGSTKERMLEAEASLNGCTVEWDSSLYGDGYAGEKIVKCLASNS